MNAETPLAVNRKRPLATTKLPNRTISTRQHCGHSTIVLSCVMLTRSFSSSERQFLKEIAKKLPKDAGERLLADMSVAQVFAENDFLKVELRDYERPDYVGHRNLPFEGKLRDVRGGPVSILVNIDQNERLLEVETIWWESESGTVLDWSALEIILVPPLEC